MGSNQESHLPDREFRTENYNGPLSSSTLGIRKIEEHWLVSRVGNTDPSTNNVSRVEQSKGTYAVVLLFEIATVFPTSAGHLAPIGGSIARIDVHFLRFHIVIAIQEKEHR